MNVGVVGPKPDGPKPSASILVLGPDGQVLIRPRPATLKNLGPDREKFLNLRPDRTRTESLVQTLNWHTCQNATFDPEIIWVGLSKIIVHRKWQDLKLIRVLLFWYSRFYNLEWCSFWIKRWLKVIRRPVKCLSKELTCSYMFEIHWKSGIHKS